MVFLTSAHFRNNIFLIAHSQMIRKSSKQTRSPDAGARRDREARYAAKDVTDKLGIKPGSSVKILGHGDAELLTRVRNKAVRKFAAGRELADVILFFPRALDEIGPTLRSSIHRIRPTGGIWVITAKKNMGEPYIPDRILIPSGLRAGLVDNKVCSVSDSKTAMRFVIRRRDRQYAAK